MKTKSIWADQILVGSCFESRLSCGCREGVDHVLLRHVWNGIFSVSAMLMEQAISHSFVDRCRYFYSNVTIHQSALDNKESARLLCSNATWTQKLRGASPSGHTGQAKLGRRGRASPNIRSQSSSRIEKFALPINHIFASKPPDWTRCAWQ
jgi:hypothetical protein